MAVSRRAKAAVRPILPVEVGPGRVRIAGGMQAGPWVFATGHRGADYRSGMAPSVLRPGSPRRHKPKHKRETEQIYRNLSAVLRAAGTNMGNVVRVDRYYATHHAVDPYHEVRRAAFRGRIPPSTSILQQGFLLAGQDHSDVDRLQKTWETADYCVFSTRRFLLGSQSVPNSPD